MKIMSFCIFMNINQKVENLGKIGDIRTVSFVPCCLLINTEH